ncbi:hypothetical protein O3G_MSEX004705 [Manduca sexta]|uniref:Alpha-1,3-mannosyl-glycoprotein 4-beta-N-acetylglucosaminyltransferase A n=1 Tax=Manduca sexta TaxID=7130 RepID=A0A922CIB3_MANSE|nr:hypothetical protein O3G_MSEX004705 [Manduca sexta]
MFNRSSSDLPPSSSINYKNLQEDSQTSTSEAFELIPIEPQQGAACAWEPVPFEQLLASADNLASLSTERTSISSDIFDDPKDEASTHFHTCDDESSTPDSLYVELLCPHCATLPQHTDPEKNFAVIKQWLRANKAVQSYSQLSLNKLQRVKKLLTKTFVAICCARHISELRRLVFCKPPKEPLWSWHDCKIFFIYGDHDKETLKALCEKPQKSNWLAKRDCFHSLKECSRSNSCYNSHWSFEFKTVVTRRRSKSEALRPTFKRGRFIRAQRQRSASVPDFRCIYKRRKVLRFSVEKETAPTPEEKPKKKIFPKIKPRTQNRSYQPLEFVSDDRKFVGDRPHRGDAFGGVYVGPECQVNNKRYVATSAVIEGSGETSKNLVHLINRDLEARNILRPPCRLHFPPYVSSSSSESEYFEATSIRDTFSPSIGRYFDVESFGEADPFSARLSHFEAAGTAGNNYRNERLYRHITLPGQHWPAANNRSWEFRRRKSTMPKCITRRFMQCCCKIIAVACLLAIISSYIYLFTHEHKIMQQLANMRHRMQYLQSQYKNEQKIVNSLKDEIHSRNDSEANSTTESPQVTSLLKNLTDYELTSKGTIVNGAHVKHYVSLNDFNGIYTSNEKYYKPAFYIKSNRDVANVVVGIPSIKREKDNYLPTTLKFLVEGLSEEEYRNTLIMIFIGEVDFDYVLEVSMMLERNFYKEMKDGLIEVLSPEKNFYPDMDKLPVTLGDPPSRVQWRSKQNLDALFLMSVARFRGLHYLMMEDDVVAKPNYMQDIVGFITSSTASHPDWVLIDFSPIGGIGKMFKTTDLAHFTAYLELFFYNMPLDWLVDSYIANRACGIDKISKDCVDKKAKIRIQYKSSLFQHIGLHSSLKGKLQKVKDNKFGTLPTFVPHSNPPVIDIKTTIEEKSDHKIIDAYNGKTYFWGIFPKKDDYIEFIFKEPIALRRFAIYSGNLEHLDDIFKDADVSLKKNGQDDYTVITKFTDLGIAKAEVADYFGPVTSLKIHVNNDHDKWVIISEIKIKTGDPAHQ